MGRKIKIRKFSSFSIVITVLLTILFWMVSVHSIRQFKILHEATEQYILCEQEAKNLQDASDYLTEQVRLYAMTGRKTYLDLYFEEANNTKRRENAVENLRPYFEGTEAFEALTQALNDSCNLMQLEYYSMRLEAEGNGEDLSQFPEEIQNIRLPDTDMHLSSKGKRERAIEAVSGQEYQEQKQKINNAVSACMEKMLDQTRAKQNHANRIFSDLYWKQEAGLLFLAFLMLALCLIMRHFVVRPLDHFGQSIEKRELFPLMGALELQQLADTYNRIFQENEETQKLIRHQAEHDALTDLLNRGSFERLLDIYEKGNAPFALILVDVDNFKTVNDTYGHAIGDAILRLVADSLKKAFRSVDYVCRIGGDEFAVIMIEMRSDLDYTIKEKIAAVNERLLTGDENLPTVTLSVGAAFSDRKKPEETLFNEADQALYDVKEHGRNGCKIYEPF